MCEKYQNHDLECEILAFLICRNEGICYISGLKHIFEIGS